MKLTQLNKGVFQNTSKLIQSQLFSLNLQKSLVENTSHYNICNHSSKNFFTKETNVSKRKLFDLKISNFFEGLKDKDDFIYIINLRNKAMKNIRREPDPIINHLYSQKNFKISIEDIQKVENIFQKLGKIEKITNAMRVCYIFIRKMHYSQSLIDFFINNTGELCEDSLLNLNAFIFYTNMLNLSPNQMNFNPNFFKIIEENFYKEGVLMDITDMKNYTKFFYRFRNHFSPKLLKFCDRCILYLMENTGSYSMGFLNHIGDIIKVIYISGSHTCFQKIIDFYVNLILVKSTNYVELIEFFKLISVFSGKTMKSQIIIDFEYKEEIIIHGFNKVKGKIYEYIKNEKVEINFLKNILNMIVYNYSICMYKNINLRDVIISYILENQTEIDAEIMKTLLKIMVGGKNFCTRYQAQITQLILANLNSFENSNNFSLFILINYLKNSIDPNKEIKSFTELLMMKSLINFSKEGINNYLSNFHSHRYFHVALEKKQMSSFLGFILLEANLNLKELLVSQGDKEGDDLKEDIETKI